MITPMTAAEKEAAEKQAAFEIGMHHYLKEAGITAADDAKVVFNIATAILRGEVKTAGDILK